MASNQVVGSSNLSGRAISEWRVDPFPAEVWLVTIGELLAMSRGDGRHPMFNCQLTPNLSATHANNLLNP